MRLKASFRWAVILITVMVLAVPYSGLASDTTSEGSASEPVENPLMNLPDLEDHSSHWAEYEPRASGTVYILVEPGIYHLISYHIARYINDLMPEWQPVLFTDGWADEVAVKNLLKNGYAVGMVGAVFIGDIPIAWYEMEDWFGGSYYGWTEFPCDLYYMDLDGAWMDADHNDVYDGHGPGFGDLEPEIWVGRILSSTVSIPGEDEISLLQKYFDKNHEYRMGNLSLPERALVYVDDDWAAWGPEYADNVGLRYTDRLLVDDNEETNAGDYMDRFDDQYDWISLFAHSWEAGHGFYINNQAQVDWMYNTDVSSLDPQAHFFNLFCCSAGNFSYSDESGYIAGHYIFSNTHALLTIASAKTGSMLNFGDFYFPLGSGASVGDAFLEWFILNGETGAGGDSRCWFYGMTIGGDPTLDTRDYVPPEAPRNLDAEISVDDVDLYWDPSPTPDVTHYIIYRSSDPYAFDFMTPYHDTSIDADPLACTFSDPTAGVTPESFYYVVRAVDNADNIDENLKVVGKFHAVVNADWNLVSIPLMQSSTDTFDALYYNQWEFARWYDPSGYWRSYSPLRPENLNDLDTINTGMGIWLKSTGTEFRVAGSMPGTTVITLKAGWNLVGYPSLNTTVTVSEALSGTGWSSVEVCDMLEPYNVMQVDGSYIMKPGEGYWVKVPIDTTWVVDW